MHRYRVCFVCTGNICRSPMAAAVFRARVAEAGLEGRVAVDSAGVGDWHVGDEADPRTVAVLAAAGYEAAHEARQFVAEWFEERDLVIALDRGHERALCAMARSRSDVDKVRLLGSYGLGDGEVPDPYYGGDDGFDACLELVEGAMEELLAEVAEAAGAGEPGAVRSDRSGTRPLPPAGRPH